jgi:hypothetical protein
MKRKWVVGLLVAAVGVAVLAWVALRPDSDLRAFRRVEPGMTRADIDALLPEGRCWGLCTIDERERWGDEPADAPSAVWFLADGFVSVAFDKDGRAVGAKLYSYDEGPVGVFRRVVGWS